MGSPFTTIAVGILLSIFISEIIAETPLDEVSDKTIYSETYLWIIELEYGGNNIVIYIFIQFQKGQIDRNNPKVKELLTKNNLDEK